MPNTERLTEQALKCLFLDHLRRRGIIHPGSTIASEYALGRSGRRIDLAIWSGEFIGIEFKSRFDSLKRLASQLEAYLKCFDRVILVADERHRAGVAALACAPVEVWSVDAAGRLFLIQGPGILRSQTAAALANLCTLAQLRRIMPANIERKGYQGRLNISASELRTEDVYAAAVEGFKRTFSHSSHAFWSRVGDQAITLTHLEALSRFAESRARRTLIQRDEQRFWQTWTQQATESLRQYAIS